MLLLASSRAEVFDSPQAAIGERLFLEPRFAHFFAIQSQGNANYVQTSGDPLLDTTVTTTGPLPGAFGGESISCRVCHMVDEHRNSANTRIYNDFARRSPIPLRPDGRTLTARNSPPLVNASLHRPGGLLFHQDGEFVNARELTIGTYTGRNYGWLPHERDQAVAHIAHIIRHDDGQSFLGSEFGGAYPQLLLGTSPLIPPEFRLAKPFRIDVTRATDLQILNALGKLVEAYMNTLTFATDETGAFSGTPYDVFLIKNKLPRRPVAGEAPTAYSRRLLAAVNRLKAPVFVDEEDGVFETHTQAFAFGPTELAGLKIFLTGPGTRRAAPAAVAAGGAANCATCHTPPTFTDFGFHNTGATQDEYDRLHGHGAFLALKIPTLVERRRAHDQWLPPTPRHPNAASVFSAPTDPANPALTDLGLWNIFGNPDFPKPQARLMRAVSKGQPATAAALLPRTIGAFKTPGLRDLSHSDPYFHHGQVDTLEEVIAFYARLSALAREGKVRNPDPALLGIALTGADLAPLAGFLRSLNEDYF